MRHAIATLIFAVSLTALGGCGQTGQLYLPEDGPPEAKSRTQTEPNETRIQSEPTETPLP